MNQPRPALLERKSDHEERRPARMHRNSSWGGRGSSTFPGRDMQESTSRGRGSSTSPGGDMQESTSTCPARKEALPRSGGPPKCTTTQAGGRDSSTSPGGDAQESTSRGRDSSTFPGGDMQESTSTRLARKEALTSSSSRARCRRRPSCPRRPSAGTPTPRRAPSQPDGQGDGFVLL